MLVHQAPRRCGQQQHAAAAALPAAALGSCAVLPAPARPKRRRCTCWSNQQQQKQQQKPGVATRLEHVTGAPPPPPPPTPQQQQQATEGWRLLDGAAYSKRWDVPWSGRDLAAAMAAWLLSFGATAFVVVPVVYRGFVGKPLWELDAAGQADFALWSEVAEALVTFAILGATVYKHRDVLQERELFRFSLARPWAAGSGWAAWALLGCGAAPLVVGTTVALLTALGYEQLAAGGRGTVDGVAGMITMDVPTYVRLLLVTGVLAPLLEETLFRGFLLTSLTKVLPNWAAILASSAAFGVAHLSLKDLPVLVALGGLLGVLYTRSRNLLTPMIVHGTWNSAVLTLLFWLAANGVDIDRMLHETAKSAGG